MGTDGIVLCSGVKIHNCPSNLFTDMKVDEGTLQGLLNSSCNKSHFSDLKQTLTTSAFNKISSHRNLEICLQYFLMCFGGGREEIKIDLNVGHYMEEQASH